MKIIYKIKIWILMMNKFSKMNFKSDRAKEMHIDNVNKTQRMITLSFART